MNDILTKSITNEEIYQPLKIIGSWKAPSKDCLHALFYKELRFSLKAICF